MNEILKKIQTLVNSAVTLITKEVEQANLASQQQQAVQHTAAMQNYATQMQQEIQKELFIVFHKSNYTPMNPIIAPKNIRINGFRFVNDHIIFSYHLAAEYIPGRTILGIIQNNMNTDIYQCQQDLIASLGIYVACSLHPYIIFGLYVIDIQPAGTDICIKVATHYYP